MCVMRSTDLLNTIMTSLKSYMSVIIIKFFWATSRVWWLKAGKNHFKKYLYHCPQGSGMDADRVCVTQVRAHMHAYTLHTYIHTPLSKPSVHGYMLANGGLLCGVKCLPSFLVGQHVSHRIPGPTQHETTHSV
jgi:hypothetical protein